MLRTGCCSVRMAGSHRWHRPRAPPPRPGRPDRPVRRGPPMIALRRRPSILRAAIFLTASIALGGAGPAAAHSPDPAYRAAYSTRTSGCRSAGDRAPSHLRAIQTAIRAAADDSNASRASQAATFVYDSAGIEPHRLWDRACGVNGIGCFTRTAPTGFTMWLREHGRVFDWGTLRWCQMQSVADERLLRRRRHRPRRVRARRDPQPPRELRRRERLHGRGRPDLLRTGRRPAGTCTSSGAATWPRSRSGTTCDPVVAVLPASIWRRS